MKINKQKDFERLITSGFLIKKFASQVFIQGRFRKRGNISTRWKENTAE